MAETLVVNVDTWGPYSGGDVVPAELPEGMDLAWAQKHGVVVPADEYRMAHPDWKPPKPEQAEEQAPAPPAAPKPSASSTSSTRPASR